MTLQHFYDAALAHHRTWHVLMCYILRPRNVCLQVRVCVCVCVCV